MVMEADVIGFKGISDSLALGESTIAVARNAAESVTDLLQEIKGKVVSAQEEGVDRGKIQTDIEALRDQISSITGAAQFNGQNLVQDYETTSVLSSLDRDANGNVSSSTIDFRGLNLTTTTGSFGSTGVTAGERMNIIDTSAVSGLATSITTATDPAGLNNDPKNALLTFGAALADGESLTLKIGDATTTFTNTTGGNLANDGTLATQIANNINALDIEGLTASVSTNDVLLEYTGASQDLEIQRTSGDQDVTVTIDLDDDADFTIGAQEAVAGAANAAMTLKARGTEITFGPDANGSVAALKEGDGYKVDIGGSEFFYVARQGDTMNDVASGLKRAIDGAGIDGITTAVRQGDNSTSPTLVIDNSSTTART